MRKTIDNAKLIEDYLSGKSCQELAAQQQVSAMTVYKRLIKNNVKIRNKWEGKTMKLPNTSLSEFHQQVIDGCLLGDGSVLRKNDRLTAHFSLTTIHEEFATHLQKILPFPKIKVKERIKKDNVVFHGKTYKCNDAYNVTSTADKSLNKFRSEWYPDGRKIVPKNLQLTPITVKYWFYGDGGTSFIRYKSDEHAYVRIFLCTNGFTVDDCELLVEKLLLLGLKFTIYLSRNQPVLVALKSSIVHNFFDYIGKCTVHCFNYKWKIPNCNK